MSRLLSILLVVGLAMPAAAAPVPADTRHAVKLTTKAEVGLVLTVKKSTKNVGTMHLSAAGKGQDPTDQKVNDIKVFEYDAEILKVDGDKIVRFSRTYTKAAIESNGTKRTPSYQGRTVYFESKDGKVVVCVMDQPPLADQDRAELEMDAADADLNNALERALEPGKGVKVGETWTLDPKKVGAALNRIGQITVDEDALKATCKLTRAYTQDKRPWGALEMAFDVPIKSIAPLTVDSSSSMTLKGTAESPLDGSPGASNSALTFKVHIKASIPSGDDNINLDADIEGTTELSIAVKKGPRDNK